MALSLITASCVGANASRKILSISACIILVDTRTSCASCPKRYSSEFSPESVHSSRRVVSGIRPSSRSSQWADSNTPLPMSGGEVRPRRLMAAACHASSVAVRIMLVVTRATHRALSRGPDTAPRAGQPIWPTTAR
ncbi:MAG: hypothetical protein ACJAYX_004089 [Planctomycetota bacterium]